MHHCKNRAQNFLQAASLLIILFLTSCTVTKALWHRTYDETFKEFLVSRDGKLIVFLGKNYHYIFSDDSGLIKELLYWHRRDLVFINAEKTDLRLDNNNNVTGYVFIESFDMDMPRQEHIFLESLGFREMPEGSLVLKLKVAGKRYLPRNDLGQSPASFDRTYVIHIDYPTGFFGGMAKVALTPITVAADATIFIGKVLLVPFRGQ